MGIVWLASYPKSGNTWLRFLFYAYFVGDIRESAAINRAIPPIHRNPDLSYAKDERVFSKTHFAWSERHPFADLTQSAIVVTRHPKDVLLSGLNYHKLTGVMTEKTPDVAYAKQFIALGGDPMWKREGYGTWAEHFESWTGQTKFPVLRLRYEDMKTDAAATLRSIVEFLGETADEEKVRHAVKQASFDNLRALEVREKTGKGKDRLFPGEVRGSKGTPRFFMNAGKTGQSIEKIGKGLDAEFDKAFADALSIVGYDA